MRAEHFETYGYSAHHQGGVGGCTAWVKVMALIPAMTVHTTVRAADQEGVQPKPKSACGGDQKAAAWALRTAVSQGAPLGPSAELREEIWLSCPCEVRGARGGVHSMWPRKDVGKAD